MYLGILVLDSVRALLAQSLVRLLFSPNFLAVFHLLLAPLGLTLCHQVSRFLGLVPQHRSLERLVLGYL